MGGKDQGECRRDTKHPPLCFPTLERLIHLRFGFSACAPENARASINTPPDPAAPLPAPPSLNIPPPQPRHRSPGTPGECQDTSMISMLPEKLDCLLILPSSSRALPSDMVSSNSIWQLLRLNCFSAPASSCQLCRPSRGSARALSLSLISQPAATARSRTAAGTGPRWQTGPRRCRRCCRSPCQSTSQPRPTECWGTPGAPRSRQRWRWWRRAPWAAG